VVGDKEEEQKTLSVTIRGGKQRMEEMSALALKEQIEAGLKDKPFIKLPLPYRLSERAKFVGG
jgi:threonyl-tRNA synthetase